MVKVTIAIASAGRASLAHTLASIGRQEIGPDLRVELVLADDSLDGSARRISEEAGLAIPLTVMDVASRNVAIARNACLEMATGDYIIFIDDDEIAEPTWIAEFVDEAEHLKVDCLFAPVLPEYGAGAPAWIWRFNPAFPEEVTHARKGEQIVGRTGNSLLRREFVEAQGLRFDDSFGAGSEDLHFFALCENAKARMATTDRAAVCEMVEPHRASLAYVLKVCFQRGKGYARVMRMTGEAGPSQVAALLFSSLAKMSACLVLTGLLMPFSRLRGIRFASSAASNLGKLAYLARGHSPQTA